MSGTPTADEGASVPFLWCYSNGQLAEGPVTTEEVRELIASGKLQPSDQIWPKGFARQMAVDVRSVMRGWLRKRTGINLPEWLADVAEAEASPMPDWVRDLRLWEELAAPHPAIETEGNPFSTASLLPGESPFSFPTLAHSTEPITPATATLSLPLTQSPSAEPIRLDDPETTVEESPNVADDDFQFIHSRSRSGRKSKKIIPPKNMIAAAMTAISFVFIGVGSLQFSTPAWLYYFLIAGFCAVGALVVLFVGKMLPQRRKKHRRPTVGP